MVPRFLALLLCLCVGLPALAPPPVVSAQEPRASWNDRFGIVGRDPWYEFNTDPANYPDALNRAFLGSMVENIRQAGAGWVRIEIRAEHQPGPGQGRIDYRKYDWFIQELAPRHGLKVLALLNAGILAGTSLTIDNLERPPDGAGGDPADGTNPYIRAFRDRAGEIAQRYGDRISAYEVLNEPNISLELGAVTNWTRQELRPERYGALLAAVYPVLKRASPGATVVTGGMLRGAPVESPARRPVDFLNDLYASPPVQWYFRQGQHFGGRRFPFDAIGSHPFFETGQDVVDHLRGLRAKMLDWGDASGRIWVTEVGMKARVAGPCRTTPSPEELRQARFLQDALNGALNQTDGAVERVFWFKYEDFSDERGDENWGLVQLAAAGYNRYDARGTVAVAKSAWRAFQATAGAALPTDPVPPSTNPAVRYVAQTGHTLQDGFRAFWEERQGLTYLGYPLTEPFQEDSRAVQYFERGKLVYHPEESNPSARVQVANLGRWAVGCRSTDPVPAPRGDVDYYYFVETHHTLRSGFLQYWLAHDGLERFGFPISEEMLDWNPASGEFYSVQYFERARLEYYRASTGRGAEVRLSQLGREYLARVGWLDPAGAGNANVPAPRPGPGHTSVH